MQIEQAVFTSAETDRTAGYQLTASSRGVCDADLRELSLWGPSHDSLVEQGPESGGVSFYPLPSGAFAVGKTCYAGAEYSGRGGRIYTQSLVVPRESLARFSNNPFAVLRALIAQGSVGIRSMHDAALEPIPLIGRATPVDQRLLGDVTADPGVLWIARIVQAVLSERTAAVISGRQRDRLIEALLTCLPVACRVEVSFTVGLRQSPRRPARVICVGDDPDERRGLLRQPAVAVVDLTRPAPSSAEPRTGWAGYVSQALSAPSFAALKSQLGEQRADLTLSNLDRLGNELSRRLAAADSPREARHQLRLADVGTPRPAASPAAPRRRPDARHAAFAGSTAIEDAPVADLTEAPSQILARYCPQSVARLELLDDTVFEALAGKRSAMERLKTLWPESLIQLGPQFLEESREQYVRHVLSAWRQCVEGDRIRDPAKAIGAMEVLELLLGPR